MIDSRKATGDTRRIELRGQNLWDIGFAAVQRSAWFVGIENVPDFVPGPAEEVTVRWLNAQDNAEAKGNGDELH